MSSMLLPMPPRYSHLIYARYVRSRERISYTAPTGCSSSRSALQTLILLFNRGLHPRAKGAYPCSKGVPPLRQRLNYFRPGETFQRCLSRPRFLVNSEASGGISPGDRSLKDCSQARNLSFDLPSPCCISVGRSMQKGLHPFRDANDCFAS